MPAGSVPLIIGVTGHRDLVPGELPQIEQALEGFFRSLQADFPQTSILLLTSLAEGADTLAAQVAARCGCDVEVVLPMAQELYEKDFEGDALTRLREFCSSYPTMELRLLTDSDAVEEYGEARDMQYARLGSFLAAHSHILLALWDGKYNDAVGGTGQVINFHQRDVSALVDDQERSRLDIRDDESDLVYHIVCSRQSSGAPEDGLMPGSAFWFTRDDETPRVSELPARYHLVFQRMHEFNRDIRSAPSLDQVYDLDPTDPQEEAANMVQTIRDVYKVSDALATKYQSRVLFSLRATLVAALAAGLAFITYADFSDLDYMIWVYLALVMMTLGSYMIAERLHWQRRYLDYRVLAEGLRVQFYWALSGIEMSNPSRYSHDSFFQGRDLQLGWIRNVMRYTGLKPDTHDEPGDEEFDAALENWIGDESSGQYGYYNRKASEKLSLHRNTQRVTSACFILGVLSALVLAFGGEGIGDLGGNLLVALMGLLPILAAARQNYAHRLAERELVAQYAHMRDVFANAHRLIVRTDNHDEKVSILRDLGEAALNENAQWVLRQRERPLPGGDAMS